MFNTEEPKNGFLTYNDMVFSNLSLAADGHILLKGTGARVLPIGALRKLP